MAKWGEGDPRWIVEERPDATNVNNWHWSEKNACGWSKDKIKELFTGLKIESDTAKCEIKEVEKCEGEAMVNNRKGKLIFFYEWEITLGWSGILSSSQETVKGTIVIPNLSEENEVNEVDVNVTANSNTDDAHSLKTFMHTVGKEKIREQIGKYITGLKHEFSQGLIKPTKDGDGEGKTINNLSAGFHSKVKMNNIANQPTTKKNETGVKLSTTTLELTQSFQCTGEEIYKALTVPEMVTAFTNNPVKLDVKKGGAFELFNGNIHGEFIELSQNTKIVQKWRCKQWPGGHFSTVTIDIIQYDDHTEVKLCQTGVPSSEEESTRINWERYYWEALKRTFGFGYFL